VKLGISHKLQQQQQKISLLLAAASMGQQNNNKSNKRGRAEDVHWLYPSPSFSSHLFFLRHP
ncbi:914_t:CDS:2, partial [Diversispora eburnea]